jgi:hypothetical protein
MGRTPGIILAILLSAMIYGFLPLMTSGFALALWSGATDRLIGVQVDWARVVLAGITLVTCVIAWIGRPSWSRWLLIGVIWIATVIGVAQLFVGLNAQPSLSEGIVGGSLSGGTLFTCQLPLYIFVPLYVTWYLNRAPARAFYNRFKAAPAE